jgi:hypothetical protein
MIENWRLLPINVIQNDFRNGYNFRLHAVEACCIHHLGRDPQGIDGQKQAAP